MSSSTQRPKVLVAGATGYLGGHVVEALHREGYPIRALARNPEKLGARRALCDEVVTAEATRMETLDNVVGDASVLFSCLGKHDFKRTPTVREVDYQANMNLLNAAKAGGVTRVVFVSVVGGPLLRDLGIRTAKAREQVVDAIQASGLTWTILRPSGFFNDMGDFFRMAQSGTGWIIGDGSATISPIHGADLADVIVDKLNDPDAVNRAFDVGGPETFTMKEIMTLAFDVLKKPVKLRRLPGWLVKGTATAISPFNPTVADLIRAITVMSERGAGAPNHGTHRLEAFFEALAHPPAS